MITNVVSCSIDEADVLPSVQTNADVYWFSQMVDKQVAFFSSFLLSLNKRQWHYVLLIHRLEMDCCQWLISHLSTFYLKSNFRLKNTYWVFLSTLPLSMSNLWNFFLNASIHCQTKLLILRIPFPATCLSTWFPFSRGPDILLLRALVLDLRNNPSAVSFVSYEVLWQQIVSFSLM